MTFVPEEPDYNPCKRNAFGILACENHTGPVMHMNASSDLPFPTQGPLIGGVYEKVGYPSSDIPPVITGGIRKDRGSGIGGVLGELASLLITGIQVAVPLYAVYLQSKTVNSDNTIYLPENSSSMMHYTPTTTVKEFEPLTVRQVPPTSQKPSDVLNSAYQKSLNLIHQNYREQLNELLEANRPVQSNAAKAFTEAYGPTSVQHGYLCSACF